MHLDLSNHSRLPRFFLVMDYKALKNQKFHRSQFNLAHFNKRWATVDFPEPDGPTIAVILPAGILKDTSLKIASLSGYEKATPENNNNYSKFEDCVQTDTLTFKTNTLNNIIDFNSTRYWNQIFLFSNLEKPFTCSQPFHQVTKNEISYLVRLRETVPIKR